MSGSPGRSRWTRPCILRSELDGQQGARSQGRRVRRCGFSGEACPDPAAQEYLAACDAEEQAAVVPPVWGRRRLGAAILSGSHVHERAVCQRGGSWRLHGAHQRHVQAVRGHPRSGARPGGRRSGHGPPGGNVLWSGALLLAYASDQPLKGSDRAACCRPLPLFDSFPPAGLLSGA